MPDLPRLDSLCVTLGLSGDVARLFRILSAARGRYLTSTELIEILWMDRPDGGPEDGSKSVGVLICRLRKALAGYPVELQRKGRGGSARLVARWAIHNAGQSGVQLVKVAA